MLAAADSETRARRLATLEAASDIDTLAIDEAAARMWERMRVHLAETGRRVRVNDLWIAAAAAANRLPVVTHHDGFDPVEGVAGLVVIRV